MSRPFVSVAQQAKWRQLVDEGRITQAQFDDREARSAGAALPERGVPRRRTVGPSRSASTATIGQTRY